MENACTDLWLRPTLPMSFTMANYGMPENAQPITVAVYGLVGFSKSKELSFPSDDLYVGKLFEHGQRQYEVATIIRKSDTQTMINVICMSAF